MKKSFTTLIPWDFFAVLTGNGVAFLARDLEIVIKVESNVRNRLQKAAVFGCSMDSLHL
jgi:hypothetical protein